MAKKVVSVIALLVVIAVGFFVWMMLRGPSCANLVDEELLECKSRVAYIKGQTFDCAKLTDPASALDCRIRNIKSMEDCKEVGSYEEVCRQTLSAEQVFSSDKCAEFSNENRQLCNQMFIEAPPEDCSGIANPQLRDVCNWFHIASASDCNLLQNPDEKLYCIAFMSGNITDCDKIQTQEMRLKCQRKIFGLIQHGASSP